MCSFREETLFLYTDIFSLCIPDCPITHCILILELPFAYICVFFEISHRTNALFEFSNSLFFPPPPFLNSLKEPNFCSASDFRLLRFYKLSTSRGRVLQKKYSCYENFTIFWWRNTTEKTMKSTFITVHLGIFVSIKFKPHITHEVK